MDIYNIRVLPFDANHGTEWKERMLRSVPSADMGDLTQSKGKKKKNSTSWSVSPWQLLHLLLVTDSGGFNVCERNQHEAKVLRTTMATTKCPVFPSDALKLVESLTITSWERIIHQLGATAGGYLTLKLRSLRCPSPHRYALFFFCCLFTLADEHGLLGVAWSFKYHITHTAHIFYSFWRPRCCC